MNDADDHSWIVHVCRLVQLVGALFIDTTSERVPATVDDCD